MDVCLAAHDTQMRPFKVSYNRKAFYPPVLLFDPFRLVNELILLKLQLLPSKSRVNF